MSCSCLFSLRGSGPNPLIATALRADKGALAGMDERTMGMTSGETFSFHFFGRTRAILQRILQESHRRLDLAFAVWCFR